MKIWTPPHRQRCKFTFLSAHNDSLKNIEMKKINKPKTISCIKCLLAL